MRFAPALLLLLGNAVGGVGFLSADETVAWYAFDARDGLSAELKVDSAAWQAASAGPLVAPDERPNLGSMRFDGTAGIIHAAPAERQERLSEGFTWEGFFLSPATNQCTSEPAIADRFLSQFLDEKGSSTRVTIGLATVEEGGPPHLCIALVGTSTFHAGRLPVTPDAWHHFALVHEGTGSSGTLRWYLDYELAGEVKLDGTSDRTTLKPAGPAPLTIGARLKEGKTVNRGFAGALDEIRLTARPLKIGEFLRVREITYDREVAARLFEQPATKLDWNFASAEPTETFQLEALAFAGLPQPYSKRGYPIPQQGPASLYAERALTLPAGEYCFVLRSRSDALLTADGEVLIDARQALPDNPLGKLPATDRDYVASYSSDGQAHTFALAASFDAREKDGSADVVVIYSREGGDRWQFLAGAEDLAVSPAAWTGYRGRLQKHYRAIDADRRQAAIRRGDRAWNERHEEARRISASWRITEPAEGGNPVDALIDRELAAAGRLPRPLIDDEAFFRRLSLDVRGRIPTRTELAAFLKDNRQNKRASAVDRMLASSEWADGWVGYWQDVLAENPSILKPTLNNSGPFRRWIYESFERNLPIDRFATELILMEGDNARGGTAGFAVASNNDAPMAMKAHIVMQAFLAVDMKCARCHDAPSAPYAQRDLFSLAALLNEKPVKVPATSVVPPVLPGGRAPAVTASLKQGETVEPEWTLSSLAPRDAVPDKAERPRARLAAIITAPEMPRFSDVLVNRLWKRYLGVGFIEPVDDWDAAEMSEPPRLMRLLSSMLVESGYDLKAVARLILTSKAYQRQAGALPPEDGAGRQPAYAMPVRRRLTAEQVVDSIQIAVGKGFDAEELTFDPNETRGFLNLGTPQRAWQLTSLSNERDRPALSMPVNQSIVDVLIAFGWRETRPDPITLRDHSPSPLQPLMLSNGLLSSRAVRLTEDNAVTELCLLEQSVEAFAEALFLAVLSRQPDEVEIAAVAELLAPGFDDRRTGKPKPMIVRKKRAYVDWDKHLEAEASVELLEAERIVRAGEPPTVRIEAEYRQRVEDVLWCLINSPEFVFVP